jgi:predicted nucleic acid-binding protein
MEGRTVKVVLDANLVLSLFLPLPYSGQASTHFVTWRRDRVDLLAPTLLQCEVNSALYRALEAGVVLGAEARAALQDLQALNIRYISPDPELHDRAWHWAGRLNQSKTYDAQYLALAEMERADCWTADRRLANGARQAGLGWVHWIGESVLDRP